jgi:hypothetical protein
MRLLLLRCDGERRMHVAVRPSGLVALLLLSCSSIVDEYLFDRLSQPEREFENLA